MARQPRRALKYRASTRRRSRATLVLVVAQVLPILGGVPRHAKESDVFPEYRDLISRLKASDAHFAKLFERHNQLDERIRQCDQGIESADDLTIETLKKQKLKLKDELYTILRKATA